MITTAPITETAAAKWPERSDAKRQSSRPQPAIRLEVNRQQTNAKEKIWNWGFGLFRAGSRAIFLAKNQASCDGSQDARQPSPRTALPPRVSIDPDWPFVHITLVTWSASRKSSPYGAIT